MIIRPSGAEKKHGTVGGWSAGGGVAGGQKKLRALLQHRLSKNPNAAAGRFGNLDELRQKLQALMARKMDRRLGDMPGPGGRPIMPPQAQGLALGQMVGHMKQNPLSPESILGAPAGSSWQGMFGAADAQGALNSQYLSPEQKQKILAALQAGLVKPHPVMEQFAQQPWGAWYR